MSSFITELMPLAEAAAACYHILGTGRTDGRSQDTLEVRRRDMAVALANLMPVYDGSGSSKHPLPVSEVYARLDRSRLRVEDMAGLYVRRSDLVAAIETLQRTDSRP